MIGELFKMASQIKPFLDAFENKDGKPKDEILKSLGMTEEEAADTVKKIESIKSLIVEKTMKGEIKNQKDMMDLIRNSGLVSKETFDMFMDKLDQMGEKK